MHISFVCSGNICRSPMAAMVFTEHLRRAKLDTEVTVTSSGIGDWHVGEPADGRARAVLEANGYAVRHVAAQFGDEHLDADLLLAADTGHLRALRRHVPDPDRVRLLRSFDPEAPANAELPDPYYGARDGFTEVLAMIEAAMPGLLNWVRERL